MVLAGLIIHSLEPDRAVIFSCFYQAELNDSSRDEHVRAICQQVAEQVEFQIACDAGLAAGVRGSSSRRASASAGAVSADAPRTGAVREDSGAHLIVWRQVLRTALVMLVSPDEHVGLAAYTLELLAGLAAELCKSERVFASPLDLLAKPEELCLLVELCVPAGQLVLLSGATVKQLRKEAEGLLLAGKTK